MTRPRFRRRRFRLWRLLCKLIALAGGAWFAGFLVYLIAVYNAAPPNPLPDDVVRLVMLMKARARS